ncbi:uncharacterized protein [Parasteatoda tepidariorum]|nr:uncharacterized protein LOC107453933 [Parasteatoda tepidariorum]
MFTKALVCLFVVGCTFAQDYSDDQNAREQQFAPNYAHQGYRNDIYETGKAEPYDFGFQSTDEFGTIMNRKESSDSNGAVRGSYGYTDPFGVFRHVDYVADEFGFRAEVKSNEPGMGTQSPANVQIYAEPPPAGVIVERPYYHPHGYLQGGQNGQASAQQQQKRNPTASGSNQSRQVRPVSGSSGSRGSGSTSGNRVAVYPYVAPQQNAFSSNALSTSQYPQTVSSQYAANAAAASASGSQYSSGSAYQSSASVYPSRNAYLDSQSYASQSASQHRASAGSSSASSAQQPIVAKPYDGPTYKVGNPHITDLSRSERQESGTILLPTLVTGGAPTTLVKHIHTYPSAQVA